jgi:hypothetical protein
MTPADDQALRDELASGWHRWGQDSARVHHVRASSKLSPAPTATATTPASVSTPAATAERSPTGSRPYSTGAGCRRTGMPPTPRLPGGAMADPRSVARAAAASVRSLLGPRQGDPVPLPDCVDVGCIANPTGPPGCVYCGAPMGAHQ